MTFLAWMVIIIGSGIVLLLCLLLWGLCTSAKIGDREMESIRLEGLDSEEADLH
jgi:hypothetical protein